MKYLYLLVPPARLELTAYRLGICRSILLSYGGIGKNIIDFHRELNRNVKKKTSVRPEEHPTLAELKRKACTILSRKTL